MEVFCIQCWSNGFHNPFLHCIEIHDWKSEYLIWVRWISGTTFGSTVVLGTIHSRRLHCKGECKSITVSFPHLSGNRRRLLLMLIGDHVYYRLVCPHIYQLRSLIALFTGAYINYFLDLSVNNYHLSLDLPSEPFLDYRLCPLRPEAPRFDGFPFFQLAIVLRRLVGRFSLYKSILGYST